MYNMFQNYYQPQGYQNMQNQDSRIWVQGEVGAKAYLVAPNNTVALWDSEKPIIYIKSVSSNGMPAMQIVAYTTQKEETQNDYVTKEYLDKRLSELTGGRYEPNEYNANDAGISKVQANVQR